MTFINYASKEINCKIVYYGPGLGGKTTNLQYIYNKTAPDAKGKMISLATEELTRIFLALVEKTNKGGSGAPPVFGEITDDDIDNLFKD